MDGSLYRMEGKKPWFIIRSPQGKDGNHTMIVHVTDERTVSIVAAPTGEDGRLDILITLEAHSSRKPVRRG
jgi:hypothetical protein